MLCPSVLHIPFPTIAHGILDLKTIFMNYLTIEENLDVVFACDQLATVDTALFRKLLIFCFYSRPDRRIAKEWVLPSKVTALYGS